MNKKTNAGALFSIVALAGCAGQLLDHDARSTSGEANAPSQAGGTVLTRAFEPTVLKAGKCPPAQPTCQNVVRIKAHGSPCGVEADFDPLEVDKPGTKVQWIITDPNYKFAPARGIDLPHGAPYGGSKRLNDQAWEWISNNGHAVRYDTYTINVVDANGHACVADPGLVSDW